MTRLPKNRGIAQAEEDKSLILRQMDSFTLYLLWTSQAERLLG